MTKRNYINSSLYRIHLPEMSKVSYFNTNLRKTGKANRERGTVTDV